MQFISGRGIRARPTKYREIPCHRGGWRAGDGWTDRVL